MKRLSRKAFLEKHKLSGAEDRGDFKVYMPIKLNLPNPNRSYTLRDIESFNVFPKEEQAHVQQLESLLPAEDKLMYYVTPLPDPNGDVEWYEDGVAIVRNGEIFLLAQQQGNVSKLGELVGIPVNVVPDGGHNLPDS